MTVSKEKGGDSLYGLMNSEGEMVIPLHYDKMSGFDENGWSVVGMRRSDSEKDNERYYCKYINKDDQVTLELSDKYINAWAFIRVNQKIKGFILEFEMKVGGGELEIEGKIVEMIHKDEIKILQ